MTPILIALIIRNSAAAPVAARNDNKSLALTASSTP